ncbi:HtaA domain-containing protein [Actinoallomurus vinaceus]|uniref:HtaA domain-containing protein n=1 Tax=Actinoallomurus vinaceus TaxID=1080074 RepID=UPI0031EF7187
MLLFAGAMLDLAALLGGRPAAATPRPAPTAAVVGGYLDWALLDTIRVAAPDAAKAPAEPSVTVSDGARRRPDGGFQFVAAGGSYDTGSKAATVHYRGTVTLAYPDDTVVIADPTVVLSASKAVLRADVDAVTAGPAGGASPTATPETTASPGGTARQAEIGRLVTYGLPPETSSRTMTWSQVPATLTATGARVLPDTREGGSLGSLTIAATVRTSVPSSAATRAKALATTGSPTTTPSPTATSPTPCPTDTTGTSATPTGSPSPTATSTDCASPDPSPSSSTDPGNSTTSGNNGSLAKTGSRIVPIMLFGTTLSVVGAGTMLVARRRAVAAARS